MHELPLHGFVLVVVSMKCSSDYRILQWNFAYFCVARRARQHTFIPGFLSPSVMYCSDPGHVEHSTRTLSDPKLLVGTTIQYSCNPGFVLQGGATITCYGREPGTPVWTSRLPHCACEYQDCLKNKIKNTKHELQVAFKERGGVIVPDAGFAWFICPLSL